MLHILWMTIKTIGIIVFILLGVLLALLLSILVIPICYRGRIEKSGENMDGKVSFSWLFHLLRVSVIYQEKKIAYEIYLVGIPLLKIRRKFRKKKEPKQEQELPAHEQEEPEQEQELPPHEQELPPHEQEKPEKVKEESEKKIQEEKTPRQKGTPVRHTTQQRESKKIKLTIQSIYDKIRKISQFLKNDTTKDALAFVWKHGKKIIRHVLPGKMRGKLKFGFEDPSLTGQVLGVIGCFYPVYKDDLQVIPIFEEAILEVSGRFRGRIIIGYLLVEGLQVCFNKNVKSVYKRWKMDFASADGE